MTTSRKEKTLGIRDLSKCTILAKNCEMHTMSIGIANVGGPNIGKGTTRRRKLALTGLVLKQQPTIFFLQEFLWQSNASFVFNPKQYEYVGHNEAGILFDRNKVFVLFLNVVWIGKKLEDMKLNGILPMEYILPQKRMCMVQIICRALPHEPFLCISWHGPYKRITETDRINELVSLLKFIGFISKQMDLPFIIAGDFNISFKKVSEIVPNDFSIYSYDPLRRKEGLYIDFFIGTRKILLSEMCAVDWKNVVNDTNVRDIFDHDPITCTLSSFVGKPSIYSNSYSHN